MSVDDSAFDGFLRKVAHMHTQGKASFEAEFDVSQLGLGLLLRAHHQMYISFFCTHTRAHTRTTHTQHTRTSVHTRVHAHTVHWHEDSLIHSGSRAQLCTEQIQEHLSM